MLHTPEDWYHQPRFEVRTRKRRNDAPYDLVIYDETRGANVYRDSQVFSMPLDTPEDHMRTIVAELERTRRTATVIFTAWRTTKKGHVVHEMGSICGDVIAQNHRQRVVLDLGNNRHIIPAERHVRTIWGTTVTHFYPGSRYADDDEITADKVEVEGWTEPRHEELYSMVHGTSVEGWFARFAMHFNLGGKHFQWREVAARGSKHVPMNANANAHWLLMAWNQEHPDVARRLYGIKEEAK
ncbi:hypothetical protein ACH4Y0_02770 [Streptomyces sp. NPDC020707]|uniref:hypothetical protein n=1 Tax=Streptomyces sp. NPDC020707 TaxID=3365084 RepID=UPI0037B17D9E